jgi:hypothetical protein
MRFASSQNVKNCYIGTLPVGRSMFGNGAIERQNPAFSAVAVAGAVA